MPDTIDDFVVCEGNREAFDIIKPIMQKHDEPVHLFIVGPEGSGKSTLTRLRFVDRDLLSTRKSIYIKCREIAKIIRSNINGDFPEDAGMDQFLDDLGTRDVLFLDDFDGFWADEEMGVETGRLLISARNAMGLDTVITSRKSMAEHDLSKFSGVLDDYQEITIAPLANEDLVTFVAQAQEKLKTEESPVLTEDALRYIALEMGETPERLRRIVEFFMTQLQDVEPGTELDREFVVSATS